MMHHAGRWMLVLGLVWGVGAVQAEETGTSQADPGTTREIERMSQPIYPAQVEVDPLEQVMDERKINPALAKLGRGAANTFGGWLEIPAQIRRGVKKTDWLAGGLTGLGTGIVRGVARTGVGLYEIITFPFPCPPEYRPILPPVDYFRS